MPRPLSCGAPPVIARPRPPWAGMSLKKGGAFFPGNANLPIGLLKRANQESGLPGRRRHEKRPLPRRPRLLCALGALVVNPPKNPVHPVYPSSPSPAPRTRPAGRRRYEEADRPHARFGAPGFGPDKAGGTPAVRRRAAAFEHHGTCSSKDSCDRRLRRISRLAENQRRQPQPMGALASRGRARSH